MDVTWSKEKKGLCNYISTSITSINKNLQNFCKLDSYGTLPKMSPELLTPNEKRSLEILQKPTISKDNHRETGLLCCEKRWNQIYFIIEQSPFSRQTIQKNSDFAVLYHKQVDEYLTLEQAQELSSKTKQTIKWSIIIPCCAKLRQT